MKIDHQESPGTGNRDLYVEYRICYVLLDDLNDVLIENKSKSDVQDIVRRLFIAVAMHFRHEETLYARHGDLDGLRHSEHHSGILAKYLQLSDEIDNAEFLADWIACGLIVEQMLTRHMTEECAMYGYENTALRFDRDADLSQLRGNAHI